jgi:hypothetical protein
MVDEPHMQKARELAWSACGCAPGRSRANGTSHSDGCNRQTEAIATALSEAYRSGVEAERERVVAGVAKRKAVYEARRAGSDPLAEDSYTRHDLFNHAVEAMDWLTGELYPEAAAIRKA